MIPAPEVRATILRHPLFNHLDAAVQERLLASTREFHQPAAALLIRQGQPASHFFLVLSGKVKLFRISPDGQEKVVEIIHPGQTFAEAVMFMQRSEYPVCAEALEPVHLVSVPNLPMMQALSENPKACMHLLGHLSVRLHQRLGELETLTLQNATQRFALYLIQQLEDRSADRAEIDLMLPKRLIAARLSMQPETLSRIIGKLREDHLVEVQGRHVCIPSVEALLGRFSEPMVQRVSLR